MYAIAKGLKKGPLRKKKGSEEPKESKIKERIPRAVFELLEEQLLQEFFNVIEEPLHDSNIPLEGLFESNNTTTTAATRATSAAIRATRAGTRAICAAIIAT